MIYYNVLDNILQIYYNMGFHKQGFGKQGFSRDLTNV